MSLSEICISFLILKSRNYKKFVYVPFDTTNYSTLKEKKPRKWAEGFGLSLGAPEKVGGRLELEREGMGLGEGAGGDWIQRIGP